MPGINIPLGIGAYERDVGFQPSVILKNMILEKDSSAAGNDEVMRFQRPGCAVRQTVATGTAVRGLFYTQGVMGSLPIAAIGNKLWRFTDTASTDIGTIANDGGRVYFAATNFGLAVLSANTLYFHDGATLTQIAIPDSYIPVSITSINSYVIIACSSGRWYWIEPGEITIDPLNFATAEFKPDQLNCTIAIRDEVFMFSTETIEVWQPTGNANLILQRASGRTMERGVMARDTVVSMDNTLIWVGNDGCVYRASDGVPQRISNPGIEERIRERAGVPSAFTFTFDGHVFYVLFLPGVGTWAYDAMQDNWSEFASTGTTGWRPRCATMLGSIALLGDSTSGKVFTFDNSISTDDGTVFERAVSGVVAFEGGRQRNDSVEVWTGASADIALRMRHKDGADTAFSPYITATARAGADVVRYTRIGAARQPFRTVEFSTVSTGVLRISGASANGGRER